MEKKLIMVSSVTYAIKGRDLLRSHGIKAYIERTPNASDRVGCGYSIAVSGNVKTAIEILKSAGIKVLGTV